MDIEETGNAPPSDGVGDLFDYDAGLEEVFQKNPPAPKPNTAQPPTGGDTSGLGLGLDEEVKVSKKRKPVAKLDENRLLSQNGIPKLRRTAKHKLKLKGKGHEFSDAARILNFYQLWLDDLFPRAKFADGLAIIEKLGHSKRMQTMRREWIDDEKPKTYTASHERAREETDESQARPRIVPDNQEADRNGGGTANTETSSLNKSDDQSRNVDSLFMSDDESTPRQQEGEQHSELRQISSLPGREKNTQHPEEMPEMDELDELLNEQDDGDVAPAENDPKPPTHDTGSDDELEAMEELGLLGPG